MNISLILGLGRASQPIAFRRLFTTAPPIISEWISNAQRTTLIEHDTVSLSRVRALVSTVEVSTKVAEEYRTGEPLPEGWSLILFRPVEATTTSLALDGTEDGPHHAPPPLERMWVSGSFNFDPRASKALRIGDDVTAEIKLEGITEKVGRDGRAGWYVTQRREMRRKGESGEPSVVEVRVHLYRYPAETEVTETKKNEREKPNVAVLGKNEEVAPSFEVAFQATPNLLFRYSAITFNTHRIHWDESYAVGIERRPGLIVHGPLTSLLLLNTFRVSLPSDMLSQGAKIESFNYRATRPLVVGTRVKFCGRWRAERESEGAVDGRRTRECDLWVEDEDGNRYMTGVGVVALK